MKVALFICAVGLGQVTGFGFPGGNVGERPMEPAIESPDGDHTFRLVNSMTGKCLINMDSIITQGEWQDISCDNLTKSKTWSLIPAGKNPSTYYLSYKHAPANDKPVSVGRIAFETDPLAGPLTEVTNGGKGAPYPFIIKNGRFYIQESSMEFRVLGRVGKKVVVVDEDTLVAESAAVYKAVDENNKPIEADEYA